LDCILALKATVDDLRSQGDATLKPSTPSDFDGDHTNGKAFLMSC